jgi:hypothetical protein
MLVLTTGILCASAFGAMAQDAVSVYVPGFKKMITGPVGVPLAATWTMVQHKFIEYPTRYKSDPPLPGFDWVEPHGNPRHIVYGSGVFYLHGNAFLPVREITRVSLFSVNDETYPRGGIFVNQGGDSLPSYMSHNAVIWGIDGYGFSAGGGTDTNMVRYMSGRTPTSYVYVEYYLRNEAECGPYIGCQMNLVTDRKGSAYAQAMILPLGAPGESTLRIAGTAEAQDGSGAAFSRAAGDLLLTGLFVGLVAELSKPVAVQIEESHERCKRQPGGRYMIC